MSERQWNIKDNEARIILTTNCNYKCIFCHSEGFDPYTQCKWRPTKNGILEIIDKVLELECKDITLTGGEPLIHKDIVLDVIAYVAEKSPEASVTVITNASLLTKEWICEVRKYKNVRFNVSLHSCDPEQYKYITDQKSFHIDVIKDKLIFQHP